MQYVHTHSGLINKIRHDAVKVFYILKAVDKAGSGYADVSIQDLAERFNRSWSTIRRWLRFGVKLGLFIGKVKLKPGYYRIHYKALDKFCLENGIRDLGSIIEVEINELKDIKFRATEADALRAQDKSLHAATKNHKGFSKNISSPKNLCCNPKRILFLSDRFVYRSPNDLMYGASQKYIAKQSGYSISTIQRRLDDKYRKSHGHLPIIKKQQCIRIAKDDINFEIGKRDFLNSEGENTKPIFTNNNFKGLAFSPYTNVYWIPEEDIQYRPQRYLRAKLNRKWAKKDEENQLISLANTQKPASRRINGDKNKLLIERNSIKTLRQITKSFRIKLLDWIKELNFTSCSEEFKKVFDNYIYESDELSRLIDTLFVSCDESKNNPSPQGGRVL